MLRLTSKETTTIGIHSLSLISLTIHRRLKSLNHAVIKKLMVKNLQSTIKGQIQEISDNIQGKTLHQINRTILKALIKINYRESSLEEDKVVLVIEEGKNLHRKKMIESR